MIVGVDIFLGIFTPKSSLLAIIFLSSGSLLIKNFRLYRLFLAAKDMKVVVITNLELLRAVSALVIFDAIIIVLWQAAFPITAQLQVVDPYRPAYDYYAVPLPLSQSR